MVLNLLGLSKVKKRKNDIEENEIHTWVISGPIITQRSMGIYDRNTIPK